MFQSPAWSFFGPRFLIAVALAMYAWSSRAMFQWCNEFHRTAPRDLPSREVRPWISHGLILGISSPNCGDLLLECWLFLRVWGLGLLSSPICPEESCIFTTRPTIKNSFLQRWLTCWQGMRSVLLFHGRGSQNERGS